jgi:hypothetical protein
LQPVVAGCLKLVLLVLLVYGCTMMLLVLVLVLVYRCAMLLLVVVLPWRGREAVVGRKLRRQVVR